MSDLIDHELSHEDLLKVTSTIDIPACPGVVTNAMQEAQKDEPDLGRLADRISNDASMSARSSWPIRRCMAAVTGYPASARPLTG